MDSVLNIERTKRWQLFLVVCILLTLVASALASLSALTEGFTDHRLAPLFMALTGMRVYATDPNSGPMMSTLYPPLSFWAYALAGLFTNPAPAFVTAGILVRLFVLIPVLLLLSTSGRRTTELVIATALFTCWSILSPVLVWAHLVHADAPALFLSGLAVFFTVRYFATNVIWWVFAAAVAASLAPWAKQPAVPIILAPVVALLVAKRWKPLAWYGVSVVLIEGGLMFLFSILYEFSNLWLWLMAIPSRQPWKSVWSTVLPNSNQALLLENTPALVLIFTAVWTRRRTLREYIERPWAISLVAGLLLWPTSVLGHVKVGGASNSLLYSTYFLAVAALAIMVESLAARTPKWSRTAAVVALIITSVPLLVIIAKTLVVPQRAVISPSVTAYEYMKRHPGEVYFPWYPVAGYMAEHRWYHFELGIFDRIAAGIPIDSVNFQHYLPPDMHYIAFSGTVPSATLELLPEFNRRVELPELLGWTVLAREELNGQYGRCR
jgi:hypothetical protein